MQDVVYFLPQVSARDLAQDKQNRKWLNWWLQSAGRLSLSAWHNHIVLGVCSSPLARLKSPDNFSVHTKPWNSEKPSEPLKEKKPRTSLIPMTLTNRTIRNFFYFCDLLKSFRLLLLQTFPVFMTTVYINIYLLAWSFFKRRVCVWMNKPVHYVKVHNIRMALRLLGNKHHETMHDSRCTVYP